MAHGRRIWRALTELRRRCSPTAIGIPDVTLPPDPIQSRSALRRRRWPPSSGCPPIRVLFDGGAGGSTARRTLPRLRAFVRALSDPGHKSTVVVFERRRSAQRQRGESTARQSTCSDGAHAPVRPTELHRPPAADPAACGRDAGLPLGPESLRAPQPSYTSAPLDGEHCRDRRGSRAGCGLRSSAPSVDLQVTVSEVRPDGKETFVQDGWLRASERKLDEAPSTLLEPVFILATRRRRAVACGRFTQVTVPLYYEGHVYRARLADPDHGRGTRGRPAGMGVCTDQPVRHGQRLHRPLSKAALAIDPPGGTRASASRVGCHRAPGSGASRAAYTSPTPTTPSRSQSSRDNYCPRRGKPADGDPSTSFYPGVIIRPIRFREAAARPSRRDRRGIRR